MKDAPRPTSRWLLERLALGELDETTAAELRRRLREAGEDVDQALAELAASNAALLAEHPPAAMARAIRGRAGPPPAAPRRRALWFAAPAMLAGAMALALWARPAPDRAGRPALEPARAKGPPLSRLLVYRHEAGGDRVLSDGAHAAGGDLVQLAYRERRGGFGTLLSIDGGGTVTLHWPERADGGAAPLRNDAEARLPSSYQLDDAPGFERFFFVTAPRPFALGPVLAAARALAARPDARRAALPLPATFEQTSIALDKPGAPAKEIR
jgi:hypothetical protein